MENPEEQEIPEAFSVNDWDLEKGIFNLVIALVQQRRQRMAEAVARQSVIDLLESLIKGLNESNESDTVQAKIEDFIKEQRLEDM